MLFRSFVGYECERFRTYCEPDKGCYKDWKSYTWKNTDSIGLSYSEIELKELRTPYLSSEDIEKEGWKFKGKSIDVWFEKEGIFEMHNFTVYKIVMHYNLNDHWMFIYAEDRGSEYELFKGIISSINEFRKICKWLNIK